MLVARAISRRLWVMRRTGAAVPAAGSGFESVQAAAAAWLRPGTDWVVPDGADVTLCLAMGATPLEVLLSVFGRREGASGGRMAPLAFGSRRARITTVSASPAARMGHAAGIAYASRCRELDEVTLVSVSRRGVDSGDWHEGLNFAAVHRLPVVCLVQDLVDILETPSGAAADRVVERAHGYGVSGESFDGSDFKSSGAAIERAVHRARAGDGPTVLHARVPRLRSIDAAGAILPPEQLEATARLDGLDRMRLELFAAALLDEAGEERIQRDCAGVVEAAARQAAEAPSPEPAAALDNVFSDA